MKKIFKKSIALMLVLLMTLSCVQLSSTTVSAKSKKAYWLTGSGSSAGGNASLIYNGNGKFKMKGKWGKGSSLSKSAKEWADIILEKTKNFERKDCSDIIKSILSAYCVLSSRSRSISFLVGNRAWCLSDTNPSINLIISDK